MASRFMPDLTLPHACERLIGYTFQDSMYLWEALQALGSTYCLTGTQPRLESGNERLAVIGYRVLELLLALNWYPTWQDKCRLT